MPAAALTGPPLEPPPKTASARTHARAPARRVADGRARPLAHVGLHVSAVVHADDTNTFLPPHVGGRH